MRVFNAHSCHVHLREHSLCDRAGCFRGVVFFFSSFGELEFLPLFPQGNLLFADLDFSISHAVIL